MRKEMERQLANIPESERYQTFPEPKFTVKWPNKVKAERLDTLEKVFTESVRMNHCVWSYSDAAIRGKTFLYHVEYNGTEATVEISPTGTIIQAYGPHNQVNKASQIVRKAKIQLA